MSKFKNRISSLFLVIVILLLVSIGLSACTSDVTTITYKVNGEDDVVVNVQDITSITVIDEPAKKDKYEFMGWYLDNYMWEDPFTSDYFADKERVDSITLYAYYKHTELEFVFGSTTDSFTTPTSYIVAGCKEDAVNVVIPSTYVGQPVLSIYQNAFKNCTSLETVEFEDGSQVKNIYEIFKGLEKLKSIEIPANVTSLGDESFKGCTSLETVIFNDDIKLDNIGETFARLKNFVSIEIPASVKSISEDAFIYCESLESVTFAEGSQLQDIGRKAFHSCESLTEIVIPVNVKTSEVMHSVTV